MASHGRQRQRRPSGKGSLLEWYIDPIVLLLSAVAKGLSAWEFGGANTAPLKRWEQTTIEGLTTEPIVLTGYYSQTFRPEHHNLTEHFLFEPRLEPGISAEILSQLQDMNIRFIHMILDKDGVGEDQSRIATYSFDTW